MDYKNKYLKYKSKYIKLKKIQQTGGYFDGRDLYPTIKTVDKLISSNKIFKIINKKIAPILKKKIQLNIYVVPWYVGYCDDNGDCHSIDYNAYSEYLDVYHKDWKLNKYFIIGLEATIGNENKKTKPFVNLSTFFNCFVNKLNENDKNLLFETFDKYLPRHLSWSGKDKDEIRIYYSPQSKKNISKKLIKSKLKKISTKKIRPSPSESATTFKIGTKKKGNDGNIWVIVENKNGIKRWSKIK